MIILNASFRLDLNINENECHSLKKKKKILQKSEIIKRKQIQRNSGNQRSCSYSGVVTLIPKEGDPLDSGIWRPITVLLLPSKLLEKAIHYQVINILENNL